MTAQTSGARNAKSYRHDIANGRRRVIPADEIRPHLAALEGAGWTGHAIAKAAGVAPATVTRLRRGQLTKVLAPVGEAILAVNPNTIPAVGPESMVSKVGAVRRVQALMAMGWPTRFLRAETGAHITMLLSRGGRVSRRDHDRIAAIYRELSHKPGPSERTRRYAAARGYPGPLAWDDIDHDIEPDLGEETAS